MSNLHDHFPFEGVKMPQGLNKVKHPSHGTWVPILTSPEQMLACPTETRRLTARRRAVGNRQGWQKRKGKKGETAIPGSEPVAPPNHQPSGHLGRVSLIVYTETSTTVAASHVRIQTC